MNKRKWYLILNNSHTVYEFTSEKKLREHAKERGFNIKRSYLDPRCFYLESYEYIPGK